MVVSEPGAVNVSKVILNQILSVSRWSPMMKSIWISIKQCFSIFSTYMNHLGKSIKMQTLILEIWVGQEIRSSKWCLCCQSWDHTEQQSPAPVILNPLYTLELPLKIFKNNQCTIPNQLNQNEQWRVVVSGASNKTLWKYPQVTKICSCVWDPIIYPNASEIK